MLSCVDWTHWDRVQKERRGYMQLALFDARPEPPKKPPLWERLKQDERTLVITTLARLMAKTIRQDSRRSEDER
jgi:hypothetical protein